MRLLPFILSVACLSSLAASSIARADGLSYGIRARGYLNENGEVINNVTLVVENGKITKIGRRARPPEGSITLDRSKSYIGPGLVDVHVTLGTMGRIGEAANVSEPNADAMSLFNPNHPDFERAIRAGITTVFLAPSATNLIGGTTAVVKTGGADVSARCLGAGPLKLSFASPVFLDGSRTPTSLQGALTYLRKQIAAAREKRADASPFARWARGEAEAFVEVDSAATLSALARFAREESVKCIPLLANLAAERLDDAKSFGCPIVLGTYEFHDPMRYTRTPAALEQAGVEIILTSQPPRYAPELLRVGAAIGMRNGLSRQAALASITTNPARVAGVADRLGSIEVGKDADFVLYSGDPLRLTSGVEEVFIGGERVFVRESAKASASEESN